MKYFSLALILTFSLLTAGSQEKEVTIAEPLIKARSMEVDIEFGMGDITIEPGDSEFAVFGLVSYNPRKADLIYDYSESKKTAKFDFKLDWHSNNDNDDENDGAECDLAFTDEIPIDLSIEIGLGDGELNLDKLMISNFSLENGLGDAEVDFGKKGNRVECEKIDINTGLGTAELMNLGNSNAREMEFECGLGSMELDFSGKLKSDIDIDISVGLGSIEIDVPLGTNVVFEHDANFMSSIDLDDVDEIGKGKFRSRSFQDDKPVLYFSASVGMGQY